MIGTLPQTNVADIAVRTKSARTLMIFTWLTDQSICNQKSNRVASKRLPLLIVMPSIWPAGCRQRGLTKTQVAGKRSQNSVRNRLHSESHGDGERQKRGRWKPEFRLG